MKILSPAGNFDCLKSAVYNGADEVYLGINEFNARNNVDGFTLNSLEEAVDFAHVFNVKVYLAINILFGDDELIPAVKTVVQAFNMGVDAFIVQDLGLAKILSDNYPEICLHASTQMGIHNTEGVKAVEKYGFKRIVLARETPLSEIRRIRKNSDVELEYFVQGALCVSFSGNCYLSSYLTGKSGNRGRCKQLCRLPYTLEKDGKKLKRGYLLSAKDFNMTEKLKELEQAGIDSIKIEGRARRPFYVAITTREYRLALNGKKAVQENLKLAFNRNYTAGYFDGNGNIISDIQSHIGINVGKVEKVNYGKKFNEIFFSSSRDISPRSALKFFDGSKETTVSAYDLTPLHNGVYRLTTTQKISVGARANLIVDERTETQILNETRKKPLNVSVVAMPDEPIRATVSADGLDFDVTGDVCLRAENRPLTPAEILTNFAKSDVFYAEISSVKTDGAFIPKQKLNDFRRKVFSVSFTKLAERYKKNINPIQSLPHGRVIRFNDFYFTENPVFNTSAGNVIYSPEFYCLSDVKKFMTECKKFGKKPYLDTPNFALEKDVSILRGIINETKIPIIANNYYALGFDTEIVIGAGLNVYNTISASELNRPVITAESNISERIDFPYMTLRHCPIKSHLGASCDKCNYCDGYVYRTDDGKVLRLKRKKLSTCTFYLTD